MKKLGKSIAGVLHFKNPDSPMAVTQTVHSHMTQRHPAEWATLNQGRSPTVQSSYLAPMTEPEQAAAIDIMFDELYGEWDAGDDATDDDIIQYMDICDEV